MSNNQKSGSKIQWGTIIAGAAILTGAMLFFPGVMDSVANLLSSLFTPSAAAAAPMSEATKAVIGKVAGASLLGGGLAYVMSGKKDNSSVHHHHEDKESFQDRLAIDRANNMMVMRAAYAGNPQAQQMLMNQQGR
jgi:predicted phage tail protein